MTHHVNLNHKIDFLEENGIRVFLGNTVCTDGSLVTTIQVFPGKKDLEILETAINTDPVEKYKTREEAFKGHRKWVRLHFGPRGEKECLK